MSTRLEAVFDDTDHALDAMVAVEKVGIDASAIELRAPDAQPTRQRGRDTERLVIRKEARSAVTGATIGAFAGAVLFVVVVPLTGVEQLGTAVLIAAMAGGIVGSLIGGFWGMGSQLPVNEDAFDALAVDDRAGDVKLEVRVDGRFSAERVTRVLESHGAGRIDQQTV